MSGGTSVSSYAAYSAEQEIKEAFISDGEIGPNYTRSTIHEQAVLELCSANSQRRPDNLVLLIRYPS